MEIGKSFGRDLSNAEEGKVENSSRVKNGNGRLARGEDELRRIWKENFEDLHNIGTLEQVLFHGL